MNKLALICEKEVELEQMFHSEDNRENTINPKISPCMMCNSVQNSCHYPHTPLHPQIERFYLRYGFDYAEKLGLKNGR